MRHVRIAVHTKACVETLGTRPGLEAIARAGFGVVVIWPGERGEHLDSIELAGRLGLEIAYVALPKLPGLRDRPDHALAPWVARVTARGVTRLSLIFGDTADTTASALAWDRLAAWLSSLGSSVAIENNARPSELFSQPAMIAALLARVPSLGTTLDVGHLAASGHAIGELDALLPRVVAVEAHDNDTVEDLHLPFGLGTGAGRACDTLRALPLEPELVVIETDPRAGKHPRRWVRALRADRQRVGAIMHGPELVA